MRYWLLIFWASLACAGDLPLLYGKNLAIPSSPQEIALVAHATESLQKAFNFDSKLNRTTFAHDRTANIWKCQTPSDHLLNNLCNLEGASHLHVGLLKGGSFIAALYGNQDLLHQQIGLDWFKEYPRENFNANCDWYLYADQYQIIDSGCFDFDKSVIKAPIDIYFYDADHSLRGHEMAFTYYDELFAPLFIAVVDDWGCPWIRRPTFKAFEKLGYQILYEAIIPANDEYGHGQYLAVIRKSVLTE
jgi:hypothetical protein